MSKLVYLERVYNIIYLYYFVLVDLEGTKTETHTHCTYRSYRIPGSSPGFGAKVWQISSAWSMPKRKIRNMPLGSGNGWKCCESEWLNTFDEWLSGVISIYEWYSMVMNGYDGIRRAHVGLCYFWRTDDSEVALDVEQCGAAEAWRYVHILSIYDTYIILLYNYTCNFYVYIYTYIDAIWVYMHVNISTCVYVIYVVYI